MEKKEVPQKRTVSQPAEPEKEMTPSERLEFNLRKDWEKQGLSEKQIQTLIDNFL